MTLSLGASACHRSGPAPSVEPEPPAPRASGRGRSPEAPGPPVREGRSPLDGARNRPLLGTLFSTESTFHPVELVSPGFVLASARGIGDSRTVQHHPAVLPAPYLAAELEVRASPGAGTVVVAVQSADGELAVCATVDTGSGLVALDVVVGGVPTALGSVVRPLPAGGFSLGLAVCENQPTALVRGRRGWEAVLTDESRLAGLVDLRDPSVLAGLGFAWGVRDGTARLGDARAGIFGMVGLRDPHLVQLADGTAYTEDGHVYLTWTCAGLGFFRQAHWGVFRWDPRNPGSLEQVAHVFSRRDGLVVGDHAGQIVKDGGTWILATSSWGTFDGDGVHVRAARTTTSPLAGVHVLDTTRVGLPTGDSSWDPSMTRVAGQWYVAFVESPSQDPFDFHPALASTAAADPFDALTRVGADLARGQTEGTLIVRDVEGWKVLASDGDDRRHRVYDLQMRDVGRLAAPYGTNIPHAQVVPLRDGGWLLVSFDGTSLFEDVVGYGAHGSVVVMRG